METSQGITQDKTPHKVMSSKMKALALSMGNCQLEAKGLASRERSMSHKKSLSGGSTQPSTNGSTSSMTDTMYERWHRSNVQLPEVDKQDISEDCPLFNKGSKSTPEHQMHPEFTQSSYQRIRALEAQYPTRDYLTNRFKESSSKMMNISDRFYGMSRICYLHEQKGYKPESLFTAASIFDQYIQAIGMENFPKKSVILLATISVLLSAKLEQPISPSFTRMISLLTDQEKKLVDQKSLIKLEAEIIRKFGFDFNFQGPMAPLERFARLLNYDQVETVTVMCFQILKASLTLPSFLQYQPSMLAACVLITSINIYERDREDRLQGGFFAGFRDESGYRLNTDIWNNKMVHETTDYRIGDLSACLHDLTVFCVKKLKTKQLQDFDLEQIKSIEQYK